MSHSPRNLLKSALDQLDRLAELLERYPETREELEAKIGVERFAGIIAARQEIQQAVETLGSAAPAHASLIPE